MTSYLRRHLLPISANFWAAHWHLREWLPQVARRALGRPARVPVSPLELRSWLARAHDGRSAAGDLHGHRMLVFSYIPWWLDFMTAVSSVLIGRGASIDLAWLPYNGYHLESDGQDARVLGRYRMAFEPEFPRFRGINLGNSTGDPALGPKTDAEMRRLAAIDTQYVLHREEVDIEGGDRAVFELRLRRLRHVYAAFSALLRDRKYDGILVPSGGILEFGAVRVAVRDAGLDDQAVFFESGDLRDACIVALGRPCWEDIARERWAADAPHIVDDARRRRVERVNAEREGTNWDSYVMRYQIAEMQQNDELKRKLQLDDRPLVLVCPNVPYDAALLTLASPFPAMSAWLRDVVAYLAKRTDWQVVIRAHPAEVNLDAKQGTQSIVHSVLPTLPARMILIGPAEQINTYGIMRLAKLGLVWSSTAGLEMPVRGIPVLLAVKTHYSGKGFTFDTNTIDEFHAKLEECLDDPAPLASGLVDLAWAYYDIYMNQWARPFPWTLPTFVKDIRERSPKWVLSEEGQRRFGETFTILSRRAEAQDLVARSPLPYR